MSPSRPVLTRALLALTTLVLVAACGGKDPQTLKPYAAADGVLANSGDIRVLNVLVVAADGSDTGVVSMTIVNRGDRDDTLTGLTSGQGTVDLTGSPDLPAGQAVRFGATSDPAATITSMQRTPGQNIVLTLTFAQTLPITITTPVVAATGPYASITPGPATPVEPIETPTDEATDTSSASPSSSPTGE